MSSQTKKIIIFFGPPGSGKGTQADILGAKLFLPVISPGELLRHERDKGTKLGKEVAVLMAKGKLVPNKIIEKLIDNRLAKKDIDNGYILDGYPRQKEQLLFLIKRFEKTLSKKDLVVAIYLKAKNSSIIKRIAGRRVCSCGASFHIKTNPPKKFGICDQCGAKLYRRKDDAPQVVRTRLKSFSLRIKPILAYFKKEKSLITIDGERSIKNVTKEIDKKIKNYIK